MQACIIHTLKDETGRIVAFANQLPSYNKAKRVTIDLMRSLPEAQGAMALLLSDIIKNVREQGVEEFDLGFVPLSFKHKQTDSNVQQVFRRAIRPVFSIEGLEQFKNKFDPQWQAKYLAWDGDKLDLPQLTSALLKSLSL